MDHQAFELLKSAIDDIKQDVKEIKTDLGHYKGFLGGVSFVFAVAWSGVTYFLTNLKGPNHG
jgi:hypothetical protein